MLRRTLLLTAITAAIFAATNATEPKPGDNGWPPAASKLDGKITVRQAQAISVALRNLDGRMIVVKQNGADVTVMQPWDFHSGSLRMRIANDLAIVDMVVEASEKARIKILQEQLSKVPGATTLTDGTPERREADRQYEEVLSAPAAGTQDLARIKVSELNLDKNEIPVTVLSALKPILDDDSK